MFVSSKFLLTTAAVATVILPSALGFFLLPCGPVLTTERSDPIVNPGGLSHHVHTIQGANGFAPETSYAQMQASSCSTCKVKEDKSVYWVPQLYVKKSDGSGSVSVPGGDFSVYYLDRKEGNEQIKAFPKDFRMIAGYMDLRTDQHELFGMGPAKQQMIRHRCIGAGSNVVTKGFPTTNCDFAFRSEIYFPSCWDGVNVDSDDHMSHVSYPSRGEFGSCPPSHPVRLPTLLMEVWWSINQVQSAWAGQSKPHYHYANDDDTGYGFHADFLNGWDEGVLEDAMVNCNPEFGQVTQCTGQFTFWSGAEQASCASNYAANHGENVLGDLSSIPIGGESVVSPSGATARVSVQEAAGPPGPAAPAAALAQASPAPPAQAPAPVQEQAPAPAPVIEESSPVVEAAGSPGYAAEENSAPEATSAADCDNN